MADQEDRVRGEPQSGEPQTGDVGKREETQQRPGSATARQGGAVAGAGGQGGGDNAVGQTSDLGGAGSDPLTQAGEATAPDDLAGMGGQRHPDGSSRDPRRQG